MPSYTIALGTDHAGYQYKEAIKHALEAEGHTIKDFGTHSEESCDYPDYVRPAAEAVVHGDADYAIVLGGSGNGEAMVANKVKGIRCGLCWSPFTAEMTRLHNDANCLAIGARTISETQALEVVRIFLGTAFETGGRHERRVAKIEVSSATSP